MSQEVDFELPSDWPGPGPIDLKQQDLPHESAAIERWCLSGHLHVDDAPSSAPPFSFFASFFKCKVTQNFNPACTLTWAIVDTRQLEAEKEEYYTDSVLDSTSLVVFKSLLQSGRHELDKVIADTILESLKKGIVPSPDRAIKTSAKLSHSSPLFLDFGAGSFSHDPVTGKYHLKCENTKKHMMLELECTPQREPIRRANDGVMKVILDQNVFQYSIPKLSISGKLSVPSLNDKKVKETFNVNGNGWYNHDFGGKGSLQQATSNKALSALKDNCELSSFSLQLSNNMEISVTRMLDPVTKEILHDSTIISSNSFERKECPDVKIDVLSDEWVSIRTCLSFHTKYRITIPSANIELMVEAAIKEQEFLTYIGRPSWNGRMNVSGIVDGSPVTGLGFLEMNPGIQPPKLDQFYDIINKEVRKELEKIIPLNPSLEQAASIVCSPAHKHLMKDIDINVVVETIIKPLRAITDRGGNGMIFMMLLIDLAGGNSNKNRFILAIISILLAGVLILDDVQDESEKRRGGPACHKIYGEPIAINAGNSAYFVSMSYLQNPDLIATKNLTEAQRAYLYEQIIICLRLVSSGQALDIYGLDQFVPQAIESGDNTLLLQRLESVHTLKTSGPAANLARICATLGGGTREQVECLGNYYSANALALQIMDDIINLRGFENESKQRGEDISAGKITYPIVMAMSAEFVPSKEARQSIYDRLRSKPNPVYYKNKMKEIQEEMNNLAGATTYSEAKLQELQEQYETNQKLFQQHETILYGLIDELEKCGAMEFASKRAHRMAKEAWEEIDGAIEDSRFKILLGVFGKYEELTGLMYKGA